MNYERAVLAGESRRRWWSLAGLLSQHLFANSPQTERIKSRARAKAPPRWRRSGQEYFTSGCALRACASERLLSAERENAIRPRLFVRGPALLLNNIPCQREGKPPPPPPLYVQGKYWVCPWCGILRQRLKSPPRPLFRPSITWTNNKSKKPRRKNSPRHERRENKRRWLKRLSNGARLKIRRKKIKFAARAASPFLRGALRKLSLSFGIYHGADGVECHELQTLPAADNNIAAASPR